MTLTYQASEQASPFYGMMGVAKAALECCVRYLAVEMGAKRVRVNAISPGPIATPAAIGEVLSFLRNPDAINTPAGQIFRRAMARIEADARLAGESELTRANALWDVVQQRISRECAINELVTQEDVADCALFLASDLSRKITGQVLRVDCGLSTSRLMPESD
jgi:enoyl-[acyl-carrier protein] reductase I